MTAHANMQQDWVKNKEEGLKTGLLIWDLSAAFDTLDIDLLCKKLEIFGFSVMTTKWFRSFLTNRSQRVWIGQAISDLVWLTSGVPQGGILSPIIFTLFTADLEMWCKYSKIYGYADDTTTACQGKNLEEIIKNLKHDAESILKYMASNGLVANASKTIFMILNLTKNECEQQLTKEIVQTWDGPKFGLFD